VAKESVAADPYYNNVSLLLHGDGANGSTTITDSSLSPKTVTAFGNAQITTSQSKFGGSSISFDGNGDYLVIPDSVDFTLPGDFTIEMWLRLTAYDTLGTSLLKKQNNGWEFYITNNGTIYFNANGSIVICAATAAFSVGTSWRHIAFTSAGTNKRLFLDGVLLATAFNSTIPSAVSGDLWVGKYTSTEAAYDLNGQIDELRITKGIARYTANFTPPIAPFSEVVG